MKTIEGVEPVGNGMACDNEQCLMPKGEDTCSECRYSQPLYTASAIAALQAQIAEKDATINHLDYRLNVQIGMHETALEMLAEKDAEIAKWNNAWKNAAEATQQLGDERDELRNEVIALKAAVSHEADCCETYKAESDELRTKLATSREDAMRESSVAIAVLLDGKLAHTFGRHCSNSVRHGDWRKYLESYK